MRLMLKKALRQPMREQIIASSTDDILTTVITTTFQKRIDFKTILKFEFHKAERFIDQL